MSAVDAASPSERRSLREGLPLGGRLVRLEPLAEAHVAQLADAAAESRASYGYTFVPEGREAMEVYVRELLALESRDEELPFAQIRLADGRVVGLTRFLTLRRRPDEQLPYAVEIGGTWLSGSAQRSGINVEAKRLLLEHAFERWRVGRVDLKTDARNTRSRTAILALGARFEGVLRHWQPSLVPGEEELLRDTAIYSLLPDDWPAVRELLSTRLARAHAPEAPLSGDSLP
jgi:RimJ/RimL family protein N-acetyltransferase